MKNILREAVSWTSDAVETACGWALYVAVVYAVLFVDMGGRGNLWSHLRAMWRESQPAVAEHEGVRVIKLAPEIAPREDSFNYNYLSAEKDDGKARVAVNAVKPRMELTDVPADPGAKKDWKRGLQGELRRFTVYGHGSETTSASASVAARPAASPAGAPAAVAAAPGSAYSQGLDAPSRPAIATRARALSQNGSDSVRNLKR